MKRVAVKLLLAMLAPAMDAAHAEERVKEVFRRVRGAVVTVRTTERELALRQLAFVPAGASPATLSDSDGTDVGDHEHGGEGGAGDAR